MATLDGSANAVALEPGYILTAPGLVGSADIQAGRAPHTRAGGLESATSAFDTALKLLYLLFRMVDAGAFNLRCLCRLIRLLMKAVPFILPLLMCILGQR